MNSGHLLAASVCCFLLCIGAAAGAPSDPVFAHEEIDPDDILMSITVEDGGDAVWSIEYRTRLETDEDEAAFEDLRDDVDADPDSYAERFQERMDGTAESAESATGREMAISEMTVTAEKRELPREYGVLTYSFRWSNFAAVDGDRLLVGDAIDGLFLDEDTALLISWSENYELIETSPAPTETRSGSVIYNGPTNFAGGEPRIGLGPLDATSPPETDQSDSGSSLDTLSVAAFLGLIGVLLGGAGAVIAYRRRRRRGSTVNDETRGETDPETVDSELLSNEEQVLRLIEREGGRIKQKAVADRLGWTDAKTSQVTKKLRENGDLDGFRLGRENVLSVPEDESIPNSE